MHGKDKSNPLTGTPQWLKEKNPTNTEILPYYWYTITKLYFEEMNTVK